MPISDEISEKITKLANQNKLDLLTYLKGKISDKSITPQEVFKYAKEMVFSNKKPETYVISAEIINKLGVFVANLDDKEQAKLAIRFYKLAADRGDAWACQNYSRRLLNGNHSPLCARGSETKIW